MSQLHIFNPSHDEALAAHTPYYYPARAARILGNDLAVLPVWWAKEGDKVLLPEGVNFPAKDFLPRGVELVHLSRCKDWKDTIDQISPWGWDALLVHQLQKAGIPPRLLPDESQLEKIRELSSRRTAVQLLKALRHDHPLTVGESYLCTEEDEVWQQVATHSAAMLKAPWSSSGRGVFSATAQATESTRQRVRRILKMQGAIEVEPLYQRVTDFAVEFYADREAVTFKGLSVFATTETGAYTGNVVAEEEQLFQRLPQPIAQQLPEVIDSIAAHLHLILGKDYEGPLGVDMMCVRKEDGTLALHPCVEVNLRRTMGHVALALRSFIPPKDVYLYSLRPVGPTSSSTICLTPNAKDMEAVLQPLKA